MDIVAMRMCEACPLHLTRHQVVCPVGPLDAKVVLVGEAPGETEDRGGEPFTGKAGKRLDWLLNAAGIKRTDVLITNTVMCRPPNNRKPRADEKRACGVWLDAVLREVEPDVVLTLGDVATTALLGKGYPLKSWHGRKVEARPTVIPMYHPAATLHNPNLSPVLIA